MSERNSASGDVKFFTRHGYTYTAIYGRKGELIKLGRQGDAGGRESVIIPVNSQTFRRLADNNRGDKLTAV